MALTTALTLALFAQGAVAATPAAAGEYGYDQLVEGQNRAAIEQIRQNDTEQAADPAVLINEGVALARLGDFETARERFEAVLALREVVELETAEGKWVTSRQLARRGLTMLDAGEFQRYYLSMK